MFFFRKNKYFDDGRLQGQFSFNVISVTHDIKGFHVQICHRGFPEGAIYNMSHFGPFLRVSLERWPQFMGPPWIFLHRVSALTWHILFLWTVAHFSGGVQNCIVTVKTTVTMTITRVSRTFPICQVWQIWSLFGQNLFSRWSRQKVKPMNNFRFFWATRFFLEVSECFKNFNSKFWKKYRPLCSFRLFNWLVQVGVPNPIGS